MRPGRRHPVPSLVNGGKMPKEPDAPRGLLRDRVGLRRQPREENQTLHPSLNRLRRGGQLRSRYGFGIDYPAWVHFLAALCALQAC